MKIKASWQIDGSRLQVTEVFSEVLSCLGAHLQSFLRMIFCHNFLEAFKNILMDHLHWRHLLAKLSATATRICTFLGYLGWHDTDRIISIYVVPPMVANSSTMVTVTCHCCQWLC
jgi:hypothetical protein